MILIPAGNIEGTGWGGKIIQSHLGAQQSINLASSFFVNRANGPGWVGNIFPKCC